MVGACVAHSPRPQRNSNERRQYSQGSYRRQRSAGNVQTSPCCSYSPSSHTAPTRTTSRKQHCALTSVLILTVCSLVSGAAASQLKQAADSTRGLQVAGSTNGHQQMRAYRPRTFSADIQARLAAGKVYDQMVQLPKVEPLSANTSVQVAEAMKAAARAHLAWAPVGMATWGSPVSNTTSSPSEPMLQLVDCINSKYQRKNMTWTLAMADEPASVEVVGAWWTNKTARVPATLVTQGTVDRIPQLYAQCRSWPGPLSVVLYLGLLQNTTANLTPENRALVEQAILQVRCREHRMTTSRSVITGAVPCGVWSMYLRGFKSPRQP